MLYWKYAILSKGFGGADFRTGEREDTPTGKVCKRPAGDLQLLHYF